MRDRKMRRILTNLIATILVITQIAVPVSGEELLLDNEVGTGGLIKAGVASLYSCNDDLLLSDNSDVLLNPSEESLVFDNATRSSGDDLVLYDSNNKISLESDSIVEADSDILSDTYYFDDSFSNSYEVTDEKDFIERNEDHVYASSESVIENAIKWGNSQLGSTSYNGRCQAFVWQCYNAAGVNIGSYNTAKACGNALITDTSIDAPRGALVFFDKVPEDSYGHVGISLGNGVMIHAGHKGVEETQFTDASYLNTWYKIAYRGWGMPNGIDPDPDPDPDSDCDCEMTKGIDKIKNGEYVLVSVKSLDDNDKIRKDSPYVVDLDNKDVVIERKLSSDSPIWEIELIENRFYNIYNRKTDKAMSLEEDSKKRLTNIHVGKYNESDHTAWWSFDEMWPGKFIIENRYSEMCATICSGDSIKQKEFLGKNDCETQTWLLVRPDKPTIKTGSIPNGEVGKSYSTTIMGTCDEWIAIEWSLADDSGALPEGLSLSKDGVISGTPKKAGKYNIKVAAENEFGISTANYSFEVTGNQTNLVEEVSLDKTTCSLNVGGNITLKATVSPSGATNKTLNWTTDNSKVATVDANGKVTAVAAGTAKISATSTDGSNKSATCTVTVAPQPTSDAVISVGEVTAKKGDTIEVPVNINMAQGAKISGMTIEISCDPHLSIVGVERGTLLTKGTFNDEEIGKGVLQWYTTGTPISGEGEIFRLKVKVDVNAEDGSYPISINYKDNKKANITDDESNNVEVQFVSGAVNIPKTILGDLTGDGEIAMGDVVKLAKAVAGSITLTDNEKLAGDVTRDGDVAMGDVVKLARFVAGSITEL